MKIQLKTTVFLLLLFPIFSIYSQNAENQSFIYLKGDILLKKGEYKIEKKLFSTKYFDQNGKRIDYEDIRFSKTKKGYFAHQNGQLLKRIEKGYFDLFGITQLSDTPVYSSDGRMTSTGSIHTDYYYCKGFGAVRSLNYLSLKSNLVLVKNMKPKEFNEKVTFYLEKGKKRDAQVHALRISSGVAMGLGLAVLATYVENEEPNPIGLTLMGIGLGGLLVSFTIFNNTQKFNLKALRNYNKIMAKL